MKDLVVVTDYPAMDMANVWQYHIHPDGRVYFTWHDNFINDAQDLLSEKEYQIKVKSGDIIQIKKKNDFVPAFIKELKLSTWRTEKQLRKEAEYGMVCDGRSIGIDVYKKERKRGYHYNSCSFQDPVKEQSFLESLIEYLHGVRLHVKKGARLRF